MTTEKKLSHSESQAVAQLESIKEMVAALECDYDRLEKLREAKADYQERDKTEPLTESWAQANPDEAEELVELEAAAGECEDQDEARERIQEDALSVEVRSGWTTMGEPLTAEEFCITLCTGGPAVRIVGDLDRGEPTRARLEHQDWGTTWQEWITTGSDHEALLTYARCFYFGE